MTARMESEGIDPFGAQPKKSATSREPGVGHKFPLHVGCLLLAWQAHGKWDKLPWGGWERGLACRNLWLS